MGEGVVPESGLAHSFPGGKRGPCGQADRARCVGVRKGGPARREAAGIGGVHHRVLYAGEGPGLLFIRRIPGSLAMPPPSDCGTSHPRRW